MTETKRPEIGEWWRTKMGTIVRVSGKAIDGTWLLEFKSGLIHRDLGDWTGCQHLPDCDSFDWVKPAEVWPKWYILDETKSRSESPWYLKRISETECLRWGKCYDGTIGFEEQSWVKQSDLWLEVTEAEALARVKPQVKSVPVRLYWYDGNIVGRYGHSPPYDQSYYEIRSDGNGGWFVEVPQ